MKRNKIFQKNILNIIEYNYKSISKMKMSSKNLNFFLKKNYQQVLDLIHS